jgi:hypothetical protein
MPATATLSWMSTTPLSGSDCPCVPVPEQLRGSERRRLCVSEPAGRAGVFCARAPELCLARSVILPG